MGEWAQEDFIYVSSARYQYRKEFIQKSDCITNDNPMRSFGDYPYISMITKERFNSPVTICTNCSFKNYGAPLIVITDDLHKLENGNTQYGNHIEFVAYEDGINIWNLEFVDGKYNINAIQRIEFPVSADQMFTLKVYINKGEFTVSLNDKSYEYSYDGLPTNFHVGITACEGNNSFYDLSIVQPTIHG